MPEDLMDKVFSLFANEGLSDEKESMLKQIAKELNQNKYAKFFKVRSEEADPSFMAFLFSVYKSIYPLKLFFADEKNVQQLKELTIESCLDQKIKETIGKLDHTALDAKAKSMPGEQLITEIKSNVDVLLSQFDQAHIISANHRYEMAAALSRLMSYNFKNFFKRFDPNFTDGSFMVEPKFPPIKVILMVNELESFLSVTEAINPEDDWIGILNIIKNCEGTDLVNPEHFIMTLKNIREIHASKIIELMVQYTTRNPVWKWKHLNIKESIGEEWLEYKKAEANAYIQKINNNKKNSQINALTKQIFEATDLVRLENYTVQLSETYRKKHVDYYVYAEGLNYLKAFLDDFIDKEIKELGDILLIRGQWTNNQMAREMSEAMHSLTECDDAIADLETVLSEDGQDGTRLRQALLRVDRDQTQARTISAIMTKINDQALEIINKGAQDLIVIGKHMKNLIEDLQKKHPELLLNWKELNLASKDPLVQRMVGDFKKINFFVQLMHLCTQ
jgi:hypothetical protein